MCSIWGLVDVVFKVYMLVMICYAVVSWVPSLRGRWSDYLAMLVEPVLAPVRSIIPPLGGLDLSFLVVILILQLVDSNIVQQRPAACYFQ